jgi:hypothetical protein
MQGLGLGQILRNVVLEMSVNTEKSVSNKIKEYNTYVGRRLNFCYLIDLLKAKKIAENLRKTRRNHSMKICL